MSERQQKAGRRDLRRVVGRDAMEVLSNQGRMLEFHDRSISNLANQLESCRRYMVEQMPSSSSVEERTEVLRRRGLWGRLRWLATGR